LAKEFTLGKSERLKSRKLIDELFNEGRSFVQAPFRVYYKLSETNKPGLQFGVGVSTKNFKKAVDRNRIKRQMREAYRLQKNQLSEAIGSTSRQLNLFFIYTGKELPDYQELFAKTGKILNRLIDIAIPKT